MRLSSFEDNLNTINTSDANFQYVSMAFPVTNWIGMAASIEGVSFVGYEQNFEGEIDDYEYESSFLGTGGLSKVVIGIGAEVSKGFSLGVNANYIFGPIDFERDINYSDNSFYDYYGVVGASIHGFQFAFGSQLELPLSKKDKVVIGATYEPAAKLNGKMTVQTFQVLSFYDGTSSVSKKISIDDYEEGDMTFDYPEAYGAGVMYHRGEQLSLGADFYLQKWSDISATSGLELDNLSDRMNLSVGMEYQPDYMSPKYFDRVSYRLGAHYSKNYIKDNSEDIFDYGINFGVGLPLRYSRTTFNIGFEFGKMAALSNATLEENYAKVLLSCSLHEMWFFKRKFE